MKRLMQRFTLIALGFLAASLAGCFVQVDVDGGQCDDAHPCPAGWSCGADGWCGKPGGTDSGGIDPDGGAGSGDPALGTACTDHGQCGSGFCADGVCCESACTGDCVACNRSGEEGLCKHAQSGTDPENDCGNFYCRSSGGCATSCSDDNQCKDRNCDSVGGSSKSC